MTLLADPAPGGACKPAAKSPWSGGGLLVGREQDLGGHLKTLDASE
jgi:hypothetical protein